MNKYRERKYAQKLFGNVLDDKFQYMLANTNCCYPEIISQAPAQAWGILWNMEKMPPSWAAAILQYATIELSHTKIDKLVKIAATDPEECF